MQVGEQGFAADVFELVVQYHALKAAGIAVRRSATATGSPLQAAVRQAAALGSASRLRGWAHDVLDAPESHAATSTTSDEPDPERRVAAAALDFRSSLSDRAG